MVECCVFSCRCLYFLCHYLLCIFMQMFILFVPWMVECCVFSCRCLYFLFIINNWANNNVVNVVYFMQMFILFVSLTISSNVVYFHAAVYTFCVINNMVECCVHFHGNIYTFCVINSGRMLCIFMQMFILFVSLTTWTNVVYFHVDVYTFCSITIWTNVVYFHADVYTFCFNNNMDECGVFTCRCLYFLFQ